MARHVVGFAITDTGYTIGSITFGHCNRLDTGAAIDTAGSTLTHQSNGQYMLYIPNVTAATGPAAFYLYVTADSSKYVEGTINPALGDEALNSTVAKEATANRLLGLVLDNHVEDDIVRDANGLKISSIIYCYDTAAHATTHDKATGVVGKYAVAVTYTSGRMTKITSTRVI